MEKTVELVPVRDEDMPEYKRRLQDSFTRAAEQAFPEWGEVIPPERDIDESLAAEGAEPLQIVYEGRNVGGAIVTGDGMAMHLDFLFIDTDCQNLHLGHAAWNAIEERYPSARTWELVTPYHEKRNIHFYVNKCGFAITEYYNEHHPDPNDPSWDSGGADYPGEDGGMFKFEKTVC